MALNSSSSSSSSISLQFKNPRSPLSVRHVLSTLAFPSGESPKSSLRISAQSSPNARSHLFSLSFQFINPRAPVSVTHVLPSLASPSGDSPKSSLRVSAESSSPSSPKARFIARRKESVSVRQLGRPLIDYMSLPASQYSVLDAERIERVDDNTFRCYVYRFKFFAFEVCPVLLVRVEEQPNGCCIKLLSCKLEGSPIVVAQNEKFDASMVNRVSCDSKQSNSSVAELTSHAVIEVSIEIPFAFRPIPVQAIESTGAQVLEQILRIMLPRFMAQLVKDYQAWASGDTSRQPLGTGEI